MAIQFFSLDTFIVVSYLLIILYIGIKAGGEVNNLKDYAISKKKFSTPTVIATIFATAVGGGTTIGLAEKAFSMGIIFLLPSFGNFIGYMFYSYIILHTTLFVKDNSFSVGELIGKLYGKSARVITGFLAICASLGYVSAQVGSIGYIVNYFFDISFFWGVIIGYGVVIIYTTFGGIRSVVFTDVIQFGVMIVAIPLLCNIGLGQIGGMAKLIESVPIENITFINDKMSISQLIILCITFAFIGFNPSFIQRLLIVKDQKQASYSVFFSSLITIPFFFLVVGIGLIALSMNPTLNSNFAFPYLIDQILPVGLKGILIAGLLSAMMSTADSDLNMIGISAVNDIFIPLCKQRLNSKQEVILARVCTFTFGILSIFIPLYFKNIIDIILFFTDFWAPTIIIPLTMSILGKKVSSQAFLICVMSGALSMYLYNCLTNSLYGAGAVVGIVTNFVVFVLFYFKKEQQSRFYKVRILDLIK